MGGGRGGFGQVRPTLRFGRDDNSSWKLYLAFPNKVVIPSEAEGSAVRPSDFRNPPPGTPNSVPQPNFKLLQKNPACP
jgi:hypothetical protein